VIAINQNERLREADREVFAAAKWKVTLVGPPPKLIYFTQTIVQKVCRFVLCLRLTRALKIAVAAHHRMTSSLAAAASAVRADLYIAHNLAALPAAAAAARSNTTRFAFDAEDFHTEELSITQRSCGDQLAREIIETRLLPACAYVSGASPLIAAAYEQKYGISVQPVLNVFPVADAPSIPLPPPSLIPRSLYWFSQTLGAGRGLEDILLAMSAMTEPPHLYLRGRVATGYSAQLSALAQRLGLLGRVSFLETAPAAQMVALAASYSLGLSVELRDPPNRAICLTNKIFTYLLAGVPVLMSRTVAQMQLANELGDAALVVDLEQPQEVARALEEFFFDAQRQVRARSKAWQLAHDRYNWEFEKGKFLAEVERAVAKQ
jgi:glycosyltransferase involved in cell wall biosynthesis